MNERELIPSWDRVDNNLHLLSKYLGYKRTKEQDRSINGIRSQVRARITLGASGLPSP